MKPKSLQNSVSKRGTVVESFFCQLSSQLGSHFWSLGLSIGARKTISKGFWACKIVWGTFFAAGQSPARNCMHSAKPGSKNHFPGCVRSPYSLRAVSSSADPPSAEFPNSLPQKKELRIGNSPIACQKTQNRLPKSGSGVSGFRGSTLSKS